MSRKLRSTLGALWLTGSVACVMGGNAAVAQEPIEPPPSGIVVELAPSAEGGDVLGIAPPAVAFSATMSTEGGPVFFAHPIGDDPSSLLEMGHVQKELDLIDEQKQKIQAAQRKMQEGMQKHFAEMHERRLVRIRDLQDEQAGRAPAGSGRGPARSEGGRGERAGAGGGAASGSDQRRLIDPPEEFQKSQERLKELRDELAKEVENVLLPHQRRRLDEISLRMKMRQRGTSGSLVDTELAKTLDISDSQKERIRERAAKVQKELEEKIAKLREEAREEILDELSPEQQRKLKDLLGKDFDDSPQIVHPPRIRRPRPAVAAEKPAAEKSAAEKPSEPQPKSEPEAERR
jgi:Spy/CpxP family protein refolding chaperone